MIDSQIKALCQYGIACGLIESCDFTWTCNKILEILHKDDFADVPAYEGALPEILDALVDYAIEHQLCEDNQVARDLFDTKLMGALTPAPHEVRNKFQELYSVSPEAATDWFYTLSKDTNYIRRDRIAKDRKWQYDCEYGKLDITINLSKPEKDPKAIAAAKNAPQSSYPLCQLCATNEGYAGRMNHPARQNHRIIPMIINHSNWYLQYSPYVYYNEHCIVFNGEHTPMQINRATFAKLLDFVEQFPHYFVGSNADLPIVGGSILSHDHFQGGHYTFAMEKAEIETKIEFEGYEDIFCGIVRWPMSVLRIRGAHKERLIDLADKILLKWRAYTDENAFIFAETDGEKHNTITPICRKRGADFELDLVLRNNITTEEHPLGVYHPHAELHHIKKENIGLIEVMGLAVLPARLNDELEKLKDVFLADRDIKLEPELEKHAAWIKELKEQYVFNEKNIEDILEKETGKVFMKVLECAGVYERSVKGKQDFLRFVESVNNSL